MQQLQSTKQPLVSINSIAGYGMGEKIFDHGTQADISNRFIGIYNIR
jgi:hypothetical protein